MDIIPERLREGPERHLFFLAVSVVIIAGFAALHNVRTPDSSVEVGYTEITTECAGIDVGICLGIERRDHTTYNYDFYEEPENGTENYYRRIESELMVRAYNTCGGNITGMEWTSEVSYMNRTGEEWNSLEEVELLPCSKTFFREMK
ncbi:MAG: hypothetical protein ABEK01_00245 [Candidatus Nanohaloarchaea archaeon]